MLLCNAHFFPGDKLWLFIQNLAWSESICEAKQYSSSSTGRSSYWRSRSRKGEKSRTMKIKAIFYREVISKRVSRQNVLLLLVSFLRHWACNNNWTGKLATAAVVVKQFHILITVKFFPCQNTYFSTENSHFCFYDQLW